ncbi:MAG: ribonuclease J, partial [Deltaproteobacteria bacterium]|nr:ribonuclease J [Deltaproteobacteria bacterium]
MNDVLKIIPLGGLGEIGLNMMVIEYSDALMVIDAGLMFPEDYMLGVDIVIPDTTYLEKRRSKIQGIVLTHGHEDHIGALPYVVRGLNVPIYGTPFTLGLVKHKFRSHNIPASMPLIEVKPRQKRVIGPFEVEFVRVSHSVVDGVGLAIRSPVGLIVHSGDFKINQIPVQGELTDMNRFAEYGEQGVLALMSDSTNVEREGYTLSEKEIGERLHAIFKDCPGRIIVALFASNIARIQQIVDAAWHEHRRIVFCGRSMEASVTIAKSLGLLRVPKAMELSLRDIRHVSDEALIIVTTGSQGEPMSVLTRIAMGFHKQIKIKERDTVILSSRFIPGNERAITHIINRLYRGGAEVIYEKVSDIHVSGHAFQEELKLMINLTKPQYFIPVHGELRHLIRHARLAREVGIAEEHILLAENGRTVVFDERGGRLAEHVPSGRVLVDGKGVGDVEHTILKQRQFLSEEGLVIAAVVLDRESGAVLYGPDVVSHGFLAEECDSDILDNARAIIMEKILESDPGDKNRPEALQGMIKKALRKYFNLVIERRPVIFPIILEICCYGQSAVLSPLGSFPEPHSCCGSREKPVWPRGSTRGRFLDFPLWPGGLLVAPGSSYRDIPCFQGVFQSDDHGFVDRRHLVDGGHRGAPVYVPGSLCIVWKAVLRWWGYRKPVGQDRGSIYWHCRRGCILIRAVADRIYY